MLISTGPVRDTAILALAMVPRFTVTGTSRGSGASGGLRGAVERTEDKKMLFRSVDEFGTRKETLCRVASAWSVDHVAPGAEKIN